MARDAVADEDAGRGERGEPPDAGAFRFLPRTLLARIRAIVFLAVFPLLAIIAALLHGQGESAFLEASALARHTARGAALRQRHVIDSVALLLRVAAASPEVSHGDADQRRRLFRTLMATEEGVLNIGLAAPDGSCVASALPFDDGLPLGDRPWFRAAMRDGRLSVGEFQVGRITGAPSLNIGLPLADGPGGAPTGVLFAAVALERLRSLAVTGGEPPRSVLVVLDARRTVLVREPAAPSVPAGSAWALPVAHSGTTIPSAEPLVRTGSDGVVRIWGFHPFGATGGGTAGTVAVGLDEATVLAQHRRTLLLNALLVLVIAAVPLYLARAVALRSVSRPLAALTVAARRVARGEPAGAAPGGDEVEEIAALQREFGAMAAALEERAAAAADAEARLRELLGAMPEVHYTARLVDGRREAEYVGPRLRTLAGLEAADLGAGGGWEAHIAEADREGVATALAAAEASRGTLQSEYRLLAADGRSVWVRDTAVAIATPGGVRLVGFLADIGERKSLEGQFLQAQKMEALGRLAAAVAHDFNNLLTVISGYAELLAVRLAGEGRTAAQVAEIRKAAERAEALTRQLLSFGRRDLDTASPVTADVNAQISGMRQMLERLCGEQVRMVLRLAPALPPVRVARGFLDQVLMNLAVNARDAMTAEGTLTISTEAVTLDEEYVRPHGDLRPGGYACITVTDTGCGMEDSIRDRIFEPFFTTKGAGKGTGLGLSTVYGIVRQMRGHIELYTAPRRGTTFKVYFPLAGGAGPASTPVPGAVIARAAGPSTPIPAGAGGEWEPPSRGAGSGFHR